MILLIIKSFKLGDNSKKRNLLLELCRANMILLLFVLLLFFLLPLGSVDAQQVNDIPGMGIIIGQKVEGVVDGTIKPNDVYAINLIAGQQVKVSISGIRTPSTGALPYINLLSPSSTSIKDDTLYDILISRYVSNEYSFTYTPAVSDTYYIWIRAGSTNFAYELEVIETRLLFKAPNVDDIPGALIGSGNYRGVVDGITDPNDVYAINLIAGQQVKVSISGIRTPSTGALPYINLLSPSSTSIKDDTLYDILISRYVSNEYSFTYTPAVSDTYYIWIRAGSTNFAYELDILGAVPVDSPPEPKPDLKIGDINGDGVINVLDATMVMQYVLGLKTLTDDQKMAADVNGDGIINVLDVTLILQNALGLINKFPA